MKTLPIKTALFLLGATVVMGLYFSIYYTGRVVLLDHDRISDLEQANQKQRADMNDLWLNEVELRGLIKQATDTSAVVPPAGPDLGIDAPLVQAATEPDCPHAWNCGAPEQMGQPVPISPADNRF